MTKTVHLGISSTDLPPPLYLSPFGEKAGTNGRLSQRLARVVNYPGALHGRLGYQAFGYGQGAVSILALTWTFATLHKVLII